MATAAVIGGGLLSFVGASQQANAAGKAGRAQEAASARQLEFAQQSQRQAVAAAESPQQLAALEKQMQQQEKGLAREEKFLSSIDPTLVEASQQALKLLRGEESSAVNPVRAQRQRQRQMLVDQLREQLGSGAETSSAGQQALQNFDFQTSQAISGAQQGSLGQLLSSSQQSGQMGRGAMANLGQLGLGISGQFGDIAQRKTNAFIGGQAGISSAGQGVVNAAGGRFAGDQIMGGAISGIGGSLIQGGITGMFSKPSPTGGGISGNQAGGNFGIGSNIA